MTLIPLAVGLRPRPREDLLSSPPGRYAAPGAKATDGELLTT
jgi:hypothetical protein